MFVKTHSNVHKQEDVTFIEGFVSLGPSKLNVCSFYTDGMLIDTGSATLLKEFIPFFHKMPFEQLALTHHHEDHTGGARYIQDHFPVPIMMHEKYIHACTKRAKYPLYRKVFWGKRKPFHATPMPKQFQSKTYTWEAIHTPGHAQDHIVLLNKNNGQLFSGDLYIHKETKVILREENIPQLIDSIRTLLTYDFKEVFCCHADYIKNGYKAFQDKLAFLTELRDEILHLAKKGWSEKEIHKTLFPKTYPVTYVSFGDWDSRYIVRTILDLL